MKKISYLISFTMCLTMGIFFVNCDPEKETDQLIIRVYNPDLAQTELYYLSQLDPKTLTPEELKEKETREADIKKLAGNMTQYNNPFGGILEKYYVRIPPGPTPCPDRPDILGCLGPDIAIRLFELGVLYEGLGETNTTRAAATPAPSAIIQIDPQRVFAKGIFNTTDDPKFKTARFTFAVVDSSLEGKDMTMIVNTTIVKDGKEQAVELKIPVKADTFSAD